MPCDDDLFGVESKKQVLLYSDTVKNENKWVET